MQLEAIDTEATKLATSARWIKRAAALATLSDDEMWIMERLAKEIRRDGASRTIADLAVYQLIENL